LATITIPNVLGMSQAGAASTLASAGLSFDSVAEVSSKAAPGIVTSQTPPAGSRVRRGSIVSLAVSSGTSLTPTTPLLPSPLAAELPSGIYLDGGSGTPHYYVSLTTEPDGTITGSLSYLYQDGQTAAVFTFSGPANSGTATLTPSSGGSPISLTYSAKKMQFGECTQYLRFAQSLAQCTFTFSPGGNLQ
jgi:beta-lactam-binding protein with PASTA domain